MKYKRIAAAALTCAVLLSLPVSALAVRKGSGEPIAAGTLLADEIAPVYTNTLSFDQIESQVQSNNLTVRSARESLDQVKAMNWNQVLSDMDDAINDMDDLIDEMTSTSTDSMASAVDGIGRALSMAQDADEAVQESAAALLASNIAQISAQTSISTYSAAQVESLKSTLKSLEEQRDDLKKQKEKYPKTIKDTERMIQSTTDQIISGAESLYLTILTTQLQYESLLDTLDATGRTLEEMRLRYSLGQISAQTLQQVENGYTTLSSSISGLETTMTTMRASLQSLVGAVPDGDLTLTDVPSVSQEKLDAIQYDTDLTKAKEKSYALYSAARSVENAKDDMDDARKETGSSSYQYRMAEHAYQSAVYQQAAAEASFELSFQNLFQAIAPAQSTLAVKQADLSYQEQACAVAELKYKQGNISANALQDAVNARESARRDVEAARLDLFTAYHNYRQAVDRGLINSAS